MTEHTLLIALTFGVYLVFVWWIGWIAYRRTQDLADFILGGQRLGSGVAALSASASDMSGWLLLGLPGLAYTAGLGSVWLAGGLLLGTWLNWRLVAKRLRILGNAYGGALTLPEYLANRFAEIAIPLRLLSAALVLVFFSIYTASGLVAGGKLFASVFALPYPLAVGLTLLSILVYTAIGGFLAVSWTDVFQGLLMALALVLVPLIAWVQLGGVEPILARLYTSAPQLLTPWYDGQGQTFGLLGILSLAAWGLGYFGQPHILARFQAISGPEQIGAARRIAVAWVALTLTGAVLTGLAGVLLIAPPLPPESRETVFIVLVNQLFHPLLAGILLASILAAIMSTADSQLLVCSSTFTQDLYHTLARRQASQTELVRTGRLAVVGVSMIAFTIALDPDSMVLDLVAYAWAGFGAAFGPTLVLSLYWPGMSGYGALAGVLVGGLTVLIWRPLAGGMLYEIVPGIILATLAIILVSRWRPASRSACERFQQILSSSNGHRSSIKLPAP